MIISKNIGFDKDCKRTTAAIAGLLCALIALAFADRAELLPPLAVMVIFAGDLCACAVITLYFGMTVRAFFPERGIRRDMAFLAADALGEALKMIFLLLPSVVYEKGAPFLQLLALLADIILSKGFAMISLETSE